MLSNFESKDIVRQLQDGANRQTLLDLYTLATGFLPELSARLKNPEVILTIERAVDTKRIVFTEGWNNARLEGGDETKVSAATTLAREIMGSSGEIEFEGRVYRLVDLTAPTRKVTKDGFREVTEDEAAELLKRFAETVPKSETERARWDEAVSMVLEPTKGRGLRLLRQLPAGRPIESLSSGPATTPSRLHPPAADEHWIEIELLYEDGTPFEGSCTVELPDGRVTEGPPAANGIVRVDGMVTAGTCKFTLRTLDAKAFKAA